MGDTFNEGDGDEQPVHHVEVSSFSLGRFEVTVGEFREFVDATGYLTTAEINGNAKVLKTGGAADRNGAHWRDPGFDQEDDHPVVCVSWFDAIEYCNWRSMEEGLQPCYTRHGSRIDCDFDANGYRLPTEAEWEYAARSRGRSCRYAWGNGPPWIDGQPAGNTRDESAKAYWHLAEVWHGYDDGHAFTSPVGRFQPNSLRLHDLSGNVYEWCWDRYDPDYYRSSPVRDPRGPGSGALRACRDAGFICPIKQECVASRGKAKPDLAFSWGGFRVARSVKKIGSSLTLEEKMPGWSMAFPVADKRQ